MVQKVDISAQSAVSVTPNDNNNLPMPSGTAYTKGVYVGTSGDLKVKMADGADCTFKSLAAGVLHNLSVQRIYASETTATGIVAVF